MDLNDAHYLALDLMSRHLDNDGWTFTFDRAVSRLGACNHRKKTVQLSRALTELNDEATVRNTVLHEIAHALIGPKHGHDAVWRAMALSIGCDGKRCSADSASVPAKYVGVCPDGHQVRRHRLPRGLSSCPECSPKFNLEYVITWHHANSV